MKVLYSKRLFYSSLVNNPSFASGGNGASTPGAATNSKGIFNVVNGKVEKIKENFPCIKKYIFTPEPPWFDCLVIK
jgi:hypothetical protein